MKRTIKHNQLKPIKKEEKPTPAGKGSEGKTIGKASPALQRAITGKKTLEEKKIDAVPLSSVEGSFYD